MNPRSFEGPMDWEYQDKGPFDPTSPFTHAAKSGSLQNGFGSPVRNGASARPNPFATPSKNQQHSSQTSTLATHSFSRQPAPPFRNPAFTTPRKPLDDMGFSEASGAEDSPAPTEASDIPNDTPELDRTSDVCMGNTIPPTKIDKSFRYGKATPSSRKHMPGRGEIPSRHNDLTRRVKRQNHDNFVRLRPKDFDWRDSEDDSDASSVPSRRNPSPRKKNKKPQAQSSGIVGSLFHMMDEHASAPENLYRWVQLGVNVFLGSICCYIIWAIVNTIGSDVRIANEAAQREALGRIAECRKEYLENGCPTNTAPKLKPLCTGWYECMTQDPASISRVKVNMKQLADILNEFFGTMNMKTMGAVAIVIFIIVFANNAAYSRKVGTQVSEPNTRPPRSSHSHSSFAPEESPDVMWVPMRTPRMRRHGLLDEGTDTDSSPPKLPQLLLHQTPSGSRSPSKRGRSLSPVKQWNSPTKNPSRGY